MTGKDFICAAALLCLFGAPAAGRQSRQRVRCGQHIDSAAEARICAYFAYKKADAEMGRAYRRLSSELSGSGGGAREKLAKAQSRWLEYRDATCDAEASHVAGGSLYSLVRDSCLTSVTAERTKRLEAYLAEMRSL